MTIWPSIYNRKPTSCMFVINLITRTMDFNKCGRRLKHCGTMHTCGTDFPAVAELTVALERAQVVRARPAILARTGAALVTLYGTTRGHGFYCIFRAQTGWLCQSSTWLQIEDIVVPASPGVNYWYIPVIHARYFAKKLQYFIKHCIDFYSKIHIV